MDAEVPTGAEAVLDFWLGSAAESPEATAAANSRWFTASRELDARIAERFGAQVELAARGELDTFSETPRGLLALVILLDQFPRNLHRGSALAFAGDARALELTLRALEVGWDAPLHPVERVFLYLPLEHAEDRAHQARCVDLFTALVVGADPEWRECLVGFHEYAVAHREVVERFGRFPHRNATLGRESSDEERAYLESGGATFGG